MKSMKSIVSDLLKRSAEEIRPVNRKEAIALAVIEKAMRGDLPSINFIRELTEDKAESKGRDVKDQIVHVRVVEQ